MPPSQRPVTVLSGGLGAGKTTLLNHLLTTGGDKQDIAVVVNDVGAVNIDAELIEHGSELSMADGGVTELSNGCICCGLQDELEQAVTELALDTEFDALVIEASGISDPVPIAKRFLPPARPSTFYSLDSVVTVVNAAQFHRAFVAGESLTATDEGRPLSELLARQVETADFIALNKCDLVTQSERRAVRRVIRTLSPDVDVVPTTEGNVAPEQLVATGRITDAAGMRARWQTALAGERADVDTGTSPESGGQPTPTHESTTGTESGSTSGPREHGHAEETANEGSGHDHTHDDADDHVHPPEALGIDSVVFEATQPLHPARFQSWLESIPASLVRLKGHCWVAGRERYALDVSQAGRQVRVGVNGRWVASLPDDRQQVYRDSRSDISWDPQWGDRETKLVCIGSDIEPDAILDGLEACVLTDSEMDDSWDEYANQFPGDGEPPSAADQQLTIDTPLG
ncbi:MAG: putative GTPases (G3E family) [Halonotius sp. J07HN6]|nr:MAG: putative GTPases (G3E family) [Halonotius sp. J07HN6]